MPFADFGQKIPSIDGRESKIFFLKTKGEKVVFRIVGKPYYISRHFVQKEDGSWNIFFCPRIMKDSKCIYCQKYFDLRKQVKEAKESGDKGAAEALNEEAKRYKETTRFYYPAINRETGEGILLEAPLSVRLKLDSYVEAGADVLNSDFVLTRTEKPGSDYYTLIRLDSKDTKPLTKKEKEEVKKVKEWDIEEMLGIKKESNQDLGEASEDELVEVAEEIFGKPSGTQEPTRSG